LAIGEILKGIPKTTIPDLIETQIREENFPTKMKERSGKETVKISKLVKVIHIKLKELLIKSNKSHIVLSNKRDQNKKKLPNSKKEEPSKFLGFIQTSLMKIFM